MEKNNISINIDSLTSTSMSHVLYKTVLYFHILRYCTMYNSKQVNTGHSNSNLESGDSLMIFSLFLMVKFNSVLEKFDYSSKSLKFCSRTEVPLYFLSFSFIISRVCCFHNKKVE